MSEIHAFVGSRDIDYAGRLLVEKDVRGLDPDDIVVSGGASGTDSYAEEHALHVGLRVISFRVAHEEDGFRIHRVMLDMAETSVMDREKTTVLPGRYPSFGAAAFVRNGYIVELADVGHVYWDRHSKGTKMTLRMMQSQGVPHDITWVKTVPRRAQVTTKGALRGAN